MIAVQYPDFYRECPWFEHLPKMLPDGWRLVIDDRWTAYGKQDGPLAGLRVLVSARVEEDGREWLHVSCSRPDRLPSYDDLCEVKRVFVGAERTAVQLFVPDSHHVNDHRYCLHLWSCLTGTVLPDFRHRTTDGRLSI